MWNPGRTLRGRFGLEGSAGTEGRLAGEQLIAGTGGGEQVVSDNGLGTLQHLTAGIGGCGRAAETDQPDLSFGRDEDLFWLHIAMYRAVTVCMVQRAADPFDDLQRLQTQHGAMVPGLEDVRQRGAFR